MKRNKHKRGTWISVNDALPRSLEEVLVCSLWGSKTFEYSIAWYDRSNKKGEWLGCRTPVTHWMRIAAPVAKKIKK